MKESELPSFFQETLDASLGRKSPRALFAVSGGSDSMALLDLADRWRRDTHAFAAVGHVDHGLRGRASKADAAFVRRESLRRGLPFRLLRAPVRALAHRAGRGLEDAARTLRYGALARMARALRCPAVVTAHTLNDQGETVFLNLIRGAGPAGLAGMAPAASWPVASSGKSPRLLRPLLEVRRETLLSYLKARGVPFRVDATNDQPLFLRNRVRPVLRAWERERPGFYERLGRLAEILRDEEDFWTRRLEGSRRKDPLGILDSVGFKRYHKAEQRRLLRRAFGLSSFLALERARLFILDTGRTPRNNVPNVSIPGGWLEKRGGLIVFRPLKASKPQKGTP